MGNLAQIKTIVDARATLLLAIAWLVVSFVIVMSWNIPYTSLWIKFSISKTYLDPVRLTHFLALALVVTQFVPRNSPIFSSSYAQPLILCGQHSLAIFCLGVFLSFAAHWILVQYGNGFFRQLIVSGAGIVIMVAVAWFLHKSAKVPNLFVHTHEDGGEKISAGPAKA
jgi:hypothetical protein